MNRIEPAHVIMLRASLAKSWYGTYHVPCIAHDLNHNARHLSLWARITAPVLELAEAAKLPLGVVLLAMGRL